MQTVFLVGGLGANAYLLSYLQQNLGSSIELKQPMGSWTAVVRGAVMHGLDDRIVKQRTLRRHYGIATSVIWDAAKYPIDRRWKDQLDGTWRIDIVRWYVHKVCCPALVSLIAG